MNAAALLFVAALALALGRRAAGQRAMSRKRKVARGIGLTLLAIFCRKRDREPAGGG
jgi:hypothetical protein